MVPSGEPSARGELGASPLAHLVVYTLERRLDGELFLVEPDGATHGVRFEAGAPVKVRFGRDQARLGDLLVERGLVERATVEGAAALGGLLGDALVLSGYLEPATLSQALADQFLARMTALYALPPSTSFQFFEGSTTLDAWGGEPVRIDPLALLWRGLRFHSACSTLREGTLAKIGDAVLAIHPRAPFARLALEPDAEQILAVLALDPCPFAELFSIDEVEPELVRALVYTLCLTRQIELGNGALPVCVEDKPANLARMKLASKVVRPSLAFDERSASRTARAGSVRGRAIIPRDEDEAPPSGRRPSAPPPRPAEASLGVASMGAGPALPPPESAIPTGDSARGSSPAPRLTERTSAPDATASTAWLGPAFSAASDDELGPALASADPLVRARALLDARNWAGAQALIRELLVDLEGAGVDRADERREATILHGAATVGIQRGDFKAIAVELDELIRERDDSAMARWVRGQVRRKLGDEAGAASDLRRVLELDPEHVEARKVLEALRGATAATTHAKPEGGLFKRLFGR